MKKNLFAIAAIALSLAACASIPEPKDPSECLVIIKTELKNRSGAPERRTFSLGLSVGDKSYSIPNQPSSYVAIVIREPSVKIIRIRSAVNEGSSGRSSNSETFVPLPYKAGYAVVSGIGFCHNIESAGGNSSTSWLETTTVREDERAELLEQLAKDGKLKGWQY
jgi:hypothetical protein